MKDKKMRKQIILLLVLTTIINASMLLIFFAVRSSPVLNEVEKFKDFISLELNEKYTSFDKLIYDLENISHTKNVSYKIKDSKHHIIKDNTNNGITLFSDITNVGQETYLITFTINKNINISQLFIESISFEVAIVMILFVIIFMLSRNKIIRPTEKIIDDIRNYKFGKKPKRNEVNNELDLIQNEFVNLTDELEEEKKEQNRIIASISHDIKTPLTSIIGYADLIKDETDLKTLKKYNDKIVKKALHMKEVLSTFDDYLVNYDKTSLKISQVSIKNIVEELNNDYKIELENNNIKFEVITKLNKDIIEVDILKLKRVFSNLISNSTRYIKDNGKITIKIFKDKETFTFLVSDNGPGIDEEIINKVFAPFYTTDKSRKISGLGLSICKEFIEMHKGTIKAYNNNGLTIEFTIPQKQVADD